MIYFFKDKKGMSLVEVMVVLVVMSLIGLGTTSLLKNLLSQQAKTNIKGDLTGLRENIIATINNDNAWTAIINNGGNATPLGCLVEDNNPATDCAHSPPPSASPPVAAAGGRGNFNVVDSSGTEVFNARTAARGFDQRGTLCNGFSAGAGNDACPFRYNLNVWFECPGATPTCPKPQITIAGELSVNPASKGEVRFNINANEYSFNIRRGERVRYEPFEIIHRQFNNAGGGACPNGASTRIVRRLTNEVSDVGNNVSLNTANSVMTIQPGTYECTVSAQGYGQSRGFKIVWRRTSAPASDQFTIGSGFTAVDSSTIVSGKIKFTIDAAAGFRVDHICTSTDPAPNQFNAGIPSSPYTNPGNSFTRVFCIRSG